MEVKNNMVQMKVMEEIARMVVRAFYDEETVIVMDVVMFMTKQSGSSVRDEDVAAEAKLQHKSVRRVLSKLEKNYLVKSFTRKETRGGKEMMQQYWRIDYKMLIDAIKLRIHRMKKALHVMPVEAITKYMCNNCTDDDGNHPCWDEHDVQQLQFGIECFECPYCENDLEEQVEKSNDHGGQADIHQRMQKQLSRLIDALKKSEEVILPPPRSEVSFIPTKKEAREGGGYGHHAAIEKETVTTRKILLSIEESGASTQQVAEQKPVVPASSSSSQGLGSFMALQTNHNQQEQAKKPPPPPISEPPNLAMPEDPAASDFLRQYMEQCQKDQERLAREEAMETEEVEKEDEMEMEDEEEEFEEVEEIVYVEGEAIPLSQVTEEHEMKMSKEEYEEYNKKLMELNE